MFRWIASLFSGHQANGRLSSPVILETTVAGVTKANPDGTPRQKLVGKCRANDALILEREPDNRYDPNAVMVKNKNGQQLGYLPRENAAEVATAMDEGHQAEAVIYMKTGGNREKPTRGLVLTITISRRA